MFGELPDRDSLEGPHTYVCMCSAAYHSWSLTTTKARRYACCITISNTYFSEQETQKSYFLAHSPLTIQLRALIGLATSKAQVLDQDLTATDRHGKRHQPTQQARLQVNDTLGFCEVLCSRCPNASAATKASDLLFEPCSMCHAIGTSLSLALHGF